MLALALLAAVPAFCGCGGPDSASVEPASALAMRQPRVGHTQTRLSDGRVLIGGGLRDVKGILPLANNDVEVFDPRSGGFRVVAQMKAVRMMHTATLLADGRVAFVGGTGGRRVDVFNPHTNRMEDGGEVLGVRAAHTATLLGDGRVLVVGGLTRAVTYHDGDFHNEQHFLKSIEVYDPQTKSSRPFARTLFIARRGHTATLLDDGRVLIVGGTGRPRTEVIDVAGGTVEWGPPLATPREDHRITRLADGRYLVTGGSAARGKSLDTAEILDAGGTRFRMLENHMQRQREDHTADLLGDGRVLITGGEDNAAGEGRRDLVLDDVEVFDPKTESFTKLRPLSIPRDDHRSSVLAERVVLVTGGEDVNDTGILSAEFVTVPEREKQNPGGR